MGSGAGHETGRGFVHGTRGGWVRRGSERCTIGTGRANVVSFRTGPVARPVRLCWITSRLYARRVLAPSVPPSKRRRAFTRRRSNPPRLPLPRSNPLPLSPPPRCSDFVSNHAATRTSPRTRASTVSLAHSHASGVYGACIRTHPITNSVGSPAPFDAVTSCTGMRAASSAFRIARRRRRASSSPHPRGRRLRPIPKSAPARVAADEDAWLAPVPSFPFAPPRGWNTRGGTRGTHLLALANRRPRGRPGWATTPAATRRGRGGERADAAGRASPGKRVQGLFAPADDLDALHGVTGDDAHGADRLRGGDCGIRGEGGTSQNLWIRGIFGELPMTRVRRAARRGGARGAQGRRLEGCARRARGAGDRAGFEGTHRWIP